MLRTPIKAPWNVVSMVCLESAILEPPSMLTHGLIDDTSNQLTRYIDIDAYAGEINTLQDYWGNQDPTGGALPTDQCNVRSMQAILRSVVYKNLTNLDEVAQFLTFFIYGTKCFRLYIGGYYMIGRTVTYVTQAGDLQPCYIEWSKDSSNTYLGVIWVVALALLSQELISLLLLLSWLLN